MPQSQSHLRRSALRRISSTPEIRRLESQVLELLRLCRAQEQRLSELEAEVAESRLGRALTRQPNLGIDL